MCIFSHLLFLFTQSVSFNKYSLLFFFFLDSVYWKSLMSLCGALLYSFQQLYGTPLCGYTLICFSIFLCVGIQAVFMITVMSNSVHIYFRFNGSVSPGQIAGQILEVEFYLVNDECIVLSGSPESSPEWLDQFLFPPSVQESSTFSTFLASGPIVIFLIFANLRGENGIFQL